MFLNEFKIYSDANPANIPPLIQADVQARAGVWYIKQMGVNQLTSGVVVAWIVWERPAGVAP
jgi:hypothetical protein